MIAREIDFNALLAGQPERKQAALDRWRDSKELYGPLSEAMLAEWFYRSNQGWLAYDYDLDQWREWSFFQWTNTREITEQALHHIRMAIGLPFGDATDADAKRWLTRSVATSIIELAKPKFARMCQWDANADLIGLPEGSYLDTSSGSIGQQAWQDYISRSLPDTVAGDWHTPSAKWDNFVFDCLEHYPLAERYAVKDYLQTWAGAALTGDANAVQQMVFLYGQPGTGKSTFTETLLSMFGAYGASVSGTRVARENNQHPQWLAGLQGKRFVTVNEVPARGNWQSEHLNSLIDGGTVEANRMRQDSINFHSTAFVAVTGNHRPTAPTGSGLWRRLRIILFQAKPVEPNPRLGKELRADLPGVFAWVLEGLERYHANGDTIPVPAVILADTSEYETDADPIRQFIDECLYIGDDARVEVKTLYDAYVEWHEQNNGGKPLGARSFSNRLNDAGFAPAEPARLNGGRAGGTARIRERARVASGSRCYAIIFTT